MLFLAVFPLPSSAEADEEPIELDAIVVTAQRPERRHETGDVNLEATPSFYSMITREEFDGKVEGLAQVIEKEAGVQVRQVGGLGSFSTVSLRGSTSDQVLVFLDGILLNDASGGGVDLSSISLSDIESIEIYRGTTPASFGKSSIGGTVNIRTLRSREGVHGNLSASYGSFETKKISGYVNHKPGRWDYLVSADYLASDNDFEFFSDNGTDWNQFDDRVERRRNAQFHENNILAKAGYDLTESVRLDFMDQWFSKKQGLPAWSNSELARTSFDTDRNIATLKLTANDLGPYRINTSIFLDYMRKVEEYDDSRGQVGLGEQFNRYTTDRLGGHGVVDWHAPWNSLSLVLDVQREKYAPEDLLDSDNHINESLRASISIGLQDSVYLFDERLIVTPALRYASIHDERRSAVDKWGRINEGGAESLDSWNPQFGARYRLIEGLILKTNIGQYVREPSFFELFGDRGFFTGNADLRPENGTNFDVGFEANWTGPNEWLTDIAFSAACFHNTVEDLITRVYDARGVGRSVNISSSNIQGVEASFKFDLRKYLRLIGNATWQDPVQENEIRAFDGMILPGRFQESYFGRFEAFYGQAKLYVEYLKEKGLFYDTANLLPAEDKEVINLGLSLVYRAFIVTAEAKNIRDKQFEDFNGYPTPGRSGFLTVQYNF